MRRLSLWLFALAATLPLAGCYYDPDYGYVRNGTGADIYYGTETTTVVSPGYVDPGFGYYDDYGGYGPGCCYSGIGVGTVWYHDRYYRGGYYRDRDWHGRPPPGGPWHGGPPGGWHGGGRPPPGGWQGGGDHRPPPGGWHGGGGRPPSGGWHGGDGGHHSPPSGGWHHDR
ncbi:MAG: hypothetical protein GAK28_00775 [Luteibacter sp.]|uniref:hypothetical protein n=1 Tax=Luteibacter sp. TaxID=1886636 RepID=UPI0013865B95|nr:hypothetical protein [Luteibacter sp.]KAF1009142.1 MAG: hypothetical protein GAK28_00775 [Luteibacter sp.]